MDMRRLIRIVEAALVLDRPSVINRNTPPPPSRRERGEGGEPKGGTYWMKGAHMVSITGTCNEITSLSGQIVLTEPEEFGFTSDELMDFLKARSRPGSARDSAAEYQSYLDGNGGDPTRMATLWSASRLAYEYALVHGWAWVAYDPPEKVHFVVTPAAAKRQIAACSERLSLLQITSVKLTLAEKFDALNDRYPELSDNKTLTFSRDELSGWMGAFGGVLDWTQGKEAPASNYLYLTVREQEPVSEFRPVDYSVYFKAQRKNVMTRDGYRLRWALALKASPPPEQPGQVTMRIPVSAGTKVGMGVSPVNKKGERLVFGDRYFHIDKSNIEMRQDGAWKPL